MRTPTSRIRSLPHRSTARTDQAQIHGDGASSKVWLKASNAQGAHRWQLPAAVIRTSTLLIPPRRLEQQQQQQQHYHRRHAPRPGGGPRLPRRGHPRVLSGVHLAMALPVHRAWPPTKRRCIHLQRSSRCSARLLYPHMLHGPRPYSKELA